jgi:CRISPR-associated endoribonuclease Cas6
MKYYELKINVRLKEDIHFKESMIKINHILNKYMIQSDFLKSIHQDKGFKLYNYSSFYPITDEVYFEGEEYFFTMRSSRKKVIVEFDKIFKIDNPFFYCLRTSFRVVSKHNLYGLYTMTPLVMLYPKYAKHDGYWMPEHPIQDFIKSINCNLLRKYKLFTGIEIDKNHNIIESIELINKPIGVKYKASIILGHKCKITLKQDTLSQQLAFFALGVGLLEKNALGFGFCNELKIEG